jgi:hypothetical protein
MAEVIRGEEDQMENNEPINPTKEVSPSPIAETVSSKCDPQAPRMNIIYLAACFAISLIAGAASGWWFAKASTIDVYVVDVKKIVEAKKKELVENYKKNPTDETIAAADKELSTFLIQLDLGLNRLGSGGNKLVLLHDIYLSGNATDATDALADSLKTELKSKKNNE